MRAGADEGTGEGPDRRAAGQEPARSIYRAPSQNRLRRHGAGPAAVETHPTPGPVPGASAGDVFSCTYPFQPITFSILKPGPGASRGRNNGRMRREMSSASSLPPRPRAGRRCGERTNGSGESGREDERTPPPRRMVAGAVSFPPAARRLRCRHAVVAGGRPGDHEEHQQQLSSQYPEAKPRCRHFMSHPAVLVHPPACPPGRQRPRCWRGTRRWPSPASPRTPATPRLRVRRR